MVFLCLQKRPTYFKCFQSFKTKAKLLTWIEQKVIINYREYKLLTRHEKYTSDQSKQNVFPYGRPLAGMTGCCQRNLYRKGKHF